MGESILAHLDFSNQDTKEQDLLTHIINVGNIAADVAEPANLSACLKLLAYCHDAGKSDRFWQSYIRGETKKQVNHSAAGARFFVQFTNESVDVTIHNKKWYKYFIEIGRYVLLAHHGLFDLIKDGIDVSKMRLQYDNMDNNYHYEDDVVSFMGMLNETLHVNDEISLQELCRQACEEFQSISNRINQLISKTINDGVSSHKETDKESKIHITQIQNFYYSCLTRLILSLLKEADIYDSVNYALSEPQERMDKSRLQGVWTEMTSEIETQYKSYKSGGNTSTLNKLRTSLADEAKDFAVIHESGVYKLSLPTGSGKTNLALRYCLNNSQRYTKSRVVYVTAFLSVLKQNVESIKGLVGSEYILEHHSNIIRDEENIKNESEQDQREYDRTKYLLESWETPIITTTLVQLSNTFFGGRASNIRRFCKLLDSNIVIDEVQSLPLKSVYSFNLMFNFLADVMNCTVIHCTATPPAFDSSYLKYPVIYGSGIVGEVIEICSQALASAPVFDRVKYYNFTGDNAETLMNTDELIDLIYEKMENRLSCLVVVNTKKAALSLYEATKNLSDQWDVVYLSTNLCGAHRNDIIKELKETLSDNRVPEKPHKRIICVSTQLIEAGVDLDFDLVFRSLAGMDSMVQAAGRCNRNGELRIQSKLAKGEVYIFLYSEENLNRLTAIKQQRDASKEALRAAEIKHKEEIDTNLVYRYYSEKYFIQNEPEMYFDLSGGHTVMDALGSNSKGRQNYAMFNNNAKFNGKIAQSFSKVADEYQLIDDDTVGVIVYYKNEDLMIQLEIAIEDGDYAGLRSILKQLQPYTVNLYRSNLKMELLRSELDGGILILHQENYDPAFGVDLGKMPDFIL